MRQGRWAGGGRRVDGGNGQESVCCRSRVSISQIAQAEDEGSGVHVFMGKEL